MKKHVICLLISLLMITPLFSVSSNAYSRGWNIYYSDGATTTWYYVFDDGSMAKGWQYIDGYWYYFTPQDEGGITLVGSAYITRYGSWTHLWDSGYEIDGETYYFDYEGKLICNANVNLDGVNFYIDENGHSHY